MNKEDCPISNNRIASKINNLTIRNLSCTNLYNIKSKMGELLRIQKIKDSAPRLIGGAVNKRKII